MHCGASPELGHDNDGDDNEGYMFFHVLAPALTTVAA